MGIPGFSGFAAEITILLGAWKAFPMLVLVTAAGMVLTAAFTLRALKSVFFADAQTTDAPPHHFEPMTLAEKSAAWLLMLATLGAGLFPKLFLDRILPCVEAMRCLKP
jgi:NADH-quinone oxidoreductase subunit M